MFRSIRAGKDSCVVLEGQKKKRERLRNEEQDLIPVSAAAAAAGLAPRCGSGQRYLKIAGVL